MASFIFYTSSKSGRSLCPTLYNVPICFQGDWQVVQLVSAFDEEEVICFSSPDKPSELKTTSLFVLSSAGECVTEKNIEYLV